jgi:hypothetical protein
LSGIKHSDALDHSDGYIDDLRQEALARQRPDRNRPAKEELELMGVEILGDLDKIHEEEI